MSFDSVFCVTNEEKIEIQNSYGKTDEDIRLMVKKMKKWIQTQPHLPHNQDDYFFDMMLKLNNFNEEKCQKKIDMYYSMRNIVPEFYLNRSPISEEMKQFMDTLMIVPLPELTSSLERVYLVRFLNTDPSKFDLISNAKYLLSIFDIRIRHDPAIGERYIYDLAGLRLGHVLKVNPLTVKKIYAVMEKAYSDKIKGIHFLNMPMIGNALISIAKMVLSEKLCNRVHSHKNIDSLNEIISSRLLPSDYNGSQTSSEELYYNWRKLVESSAPWLEEIARKKSNEELRINLEENNCSIFSGFFNMFGK